MYTATAPEFEIIDVGNKRLKQEVADFLQKNGLGMDDDIRLFVVTRHRRQMIACAGVAGNLLKCIAIDSGWRGTSLCLSLIHEAELLAAQRGEHHLFLLTSPDKVKSFQGCGFYPLATVEGVAALMENTPVGIQRYCSQLRNDRFVEGETIGSIVMNANPFTLGHQYLIEHAAGQCDWLHVFVVQEDVSAFSFRDRFAMVQAGSRHIPNVSVHPGSHYIISRGTFPGYFLKDKQVVDTVHAAIDLTLFRNYIAPALNIRHRFVGTEPFCPLTAEYNRAMHRWLEEAAGRAASITVHKVQRKTGLNNIPVSASAVRRLLKENKLADVRHLVPATSLIYLNNGMTNSLRQPPRIPAEV